MEMIVAFVLWTCSWLAALMAGMDRAVAGVSSFIQGLFWSAPIAFKAVVWFPVLTTLSSLWAVRAGLACARACISMTVLVVKLGNWTRDVWSAAPIKPAARPNSTRALDTLEVIRRRRPDVAHNTSSAPSTPSGMRNNSGQLVLSSASSMFGDNRCASASSSFSSFGSCGARVKAPFAASRQESASASSSASLGGCSVVEQTGSASAAGSDAVELGRVALALFAGLNSHRMWADSPLMLTRCNIVGSMFGARALGVVGFIVCANAELSVGGAGVQRSLLAYSVGACLQQAQVGRVFTAGRAALAVVGASDGGASGPNAWFEAAVMQQLCCHAAALMLLNKQPLSTAAA